ncbi:LTA synthase family protein [Adhaeribacter soli]|uniref:Sulfatase-like hydrolase/transferase n=1 Tax=Adhaeribacter soli TaxID=2607655 RepID=A0A5N1IS21_9BACT|nr:LTA synthase family protein [Adhaeribacter soli]KAA9332777.1 sulfatase-like hydrolase/transferase [Adhaeribacter soli]
MFWNNFRDLLKRLGWLLAIYYLLRIAFVLLNYNAFREATFAQLSGAFLIGLKFDLSAIFIINAPFILFSLLPLQVTRQKSYGLFLKVWFVLTNFPFLCLNLIDLEYFKFIGRRTSNELFTITQDIQAQTAQLILNYWYFPLIGTALLYFLLKWYPEGSKNPNVRRNLVGEILGLLVFAAFSILMIRGSIGLKPLRMANAFVQQPPVLGHVSLNSTFTFIKSINRPVLEEKHYFHSEPELLQALNFDPEKYQQQTGQPVRDNVVIIILESFASEYTGIENGGKGYTPFFDSLAAQGTLYRNNFANGRKSIEALPSILGGLPSLLNEPYITSQFQSNKLIGIGTIAKSAGYQTSFFHGAENGTMGFNTFSRIAGFDRYFGLREYPKELLKTDFDGHWGISDEPYLQYFAKELNKQQQPFLTTVFTLSSHQPYPIPPKYKGRFPKGNLPIHESIGYTDYALKQFFKAAAKQPWYPNTLFILTADHTQESLNPAYQNDLGKFKVPLLLFHPTRKLPEPHPGKITQHTDIPATIADYLNLPTNQLLPFSQSVLDTTQSGRALFFTEENYVLVRPNLVTKFGESEQATFGANPFSATASPPSAPENKQANLQELKALAQYYRNGLLHNNLYFWLKR